MAELEYLGGTDQSSLPGQPIWVSPETRLSGTFTSTRQRRLVLMRAGKLTVPPIGDIYVPWWEFPRPLIGWVEMTPQSLRVSTRQIRSQDSIGLEAFVEIVLHVRSDPGAIMAISLGHREPEQAIVRAMLRALGEECRRSDYATLIAVLPEVQQAISAALTDVSAIASPFRVIDVAVHSLVAVDAAAAAAAVERARLRQQMLRAFAVLADDRTREMGEVAIKRLLYEWMVEHPIRAADAPAEIVAAHAGPILRSDQVFHLLEAEIAVGAGNAELVRQRFEWLRVLMEQVGMRPEQWELLAQFVGQRMRLDISRLGSPGGTHNR